MKLPLVDDEIRVAVEVKDTDTEGPGRRYAIWVQGCTLHCPSCCNPEYLTPKGGTVTSIAELVERVEASASEGISLLGGEPFEQAGPLARFAEAVRARGYSVTIFSGYTLAELRERGDAGPLLAACDLLIDGRYDRDKPDTTRRWIGSTNQELHFLSDRYSPSDPQFSEPDGVELRLDNGVVTINGRPWGRGLP